MEQCSRHQIRSKGFVHFIQSKDQMLPLSYTIKHLCAPHSLRLLRFDCFKNVITTSLQEKNIALMTLETFI